MEYSLGAKSLEELKGVHPNLVKVVKMAIVNTKQDFSVHDGIRTPKEQKELVRTGASRTLKSNHLVQWDGYGHAVDLVPYVNGKSRWEWDLIYPIAEAMRAAAVHHQVMIRWGGCWDIINDLEGVSMKERQQAYVIKKLSAGAEAFTDGPHFELA
jgi:peptidoglycan LD-endopeptidase CwlK